MEREQFTFYNSFRRAAKRIKNKAARCDYYDAIVDYALTGEMPEMDKISDAAALGFELVKPNLDASRRKAEGGSRGSKSETNSKDTDKIAERCEEDTANKKKKEDKKEDKKEKEYECTTTPTPPPQNDLGQVMSFFFDRINANPSPLSCDVLRQYTETLGAPVVIHAMQVALDEKKTGFAYIKAILARYEKDGLNTLEKVLLDEQARDSKKPETNERPGHFMSREEHEARAKPIDMEKLRSVIDKI